VSLKYRKSWFGSRAAQLLENREAAHAGIEYPIGRLRVEGRVTPLWSVEREALQVARGTKWSGVSSSRGKMPIVDEVGLIACTTRFSA